MADLPESASVPPSPTRPIDRLPPVEPPTAGFILQLFIIPLVIVTIIVMVWLMFSWLAHMGSNPREMARDLRRLNDASWQRALTLAELLRNPQYAELKDDSELAGELANVLQRQLEAGRSDEAAVKLRMFLCKALGEFHVPEVVPALIAASQQEKNEIDLDVRRAAIQALAVYVANLPENVEPPAEILEPLEAASRERGENSSAGSTRDELRSHAAFALGVLGTPPALERLSFLLSDAHANTRYNAALGLARQGDERAIPVLLEMLDPANPQAAVGEVTETAQESKRLLVMKNGIRGVQELVSKNPRADLTPITGALQRLLDSPLDRFSPRVARGIRLNVEETLLQLRSATPAS